MENDLAKILSERFNKKFKRVPMSGAFGTINKGQGVREDAMEVLTGDIMCPEDFRFMIECKARADFNFWDFLNDDNENLEIDEWIWQVEEESNGKNKEPLLYIKINNKKPFVMFPKKLFMGKLIYKEYTIMRFDYFLGLEEEFFWNEI